jgi:hypothetical protein
MNEIAFEVSQENDGVGEVRTGGSYLSQNDLRIHLGHGSGERVDKIEMKEVVEPARVIVWVGPSSVVGSQAYFEIGE